MPLPKNTRKRKPLSSAAKWKREAAAWRKCADRLAKAVEHYRGEDWRHGNAKSKALTIYRSMARRRSQH
jgi:hypothetical protein